VQQLIESFADRLEALIVHCESAASVIAAPAIGTAPANIIALNDPGGCKNLFCLHPGYGLVNDYQPLAAALNGVVTALGVQSPIFSEPAWRSPSFDAVATDYVDRIRKIQPRGPYHLLGWSMGGRLAVAMAHHLERQGESMGLIGLVDMGALLELEEVSAAEISSLNASMPIYLAAARDLFRSELGLEGGRDEDERVSRTVVDVVMHYRELLRVHRYHPIRSRLHVWWAARALKSAGDLDWGRHTAGGVEVVATLDATHATIIRHPDLAAQLRDLLHLPRCAS
jgi:thioesterase domain-containing protein